VTTSGTAAGELLPATMEAHYGGLPLVLITADRPRRFRGTGAPQSVEQVGLFGCYAHEGQDLEEGDTCDLMDWKRQGPIHLNICFEEAQDTECQAIRLNDSVEVKKDQPSRCDFCPDERYLSFLQQTRFPLVVIGALPASQREAAIRFLLHLNAPLYAEAMSGIREEPQLEHLRITRIEPIWRCSAQHAYPIDGILRLGGVPTARFWRDLEDCAGHIAVCSISEQPFSGLSYGAFIHAPLPQFFAWVRTVTMPHHYHHEHWQRADRRGHQELLALFQALPLAEASLIHCLSKIIPKGSRLYLGNSLPIREWDQAATYQSRHFEISGNRGVNGIDGQFSTFLGYCSAEQENWSILGDLTLLYDLVAPWITNQLPDIRANVVVINNGGAGIFARLFAHPAFQNRHQLTFESLAQFWGWRYERWSSIPSSLPSSVGGCLIELVPDLESTQHFLRSVQKI